MFIRRLQMTAVFVGSCTALTACGTKSEDTAPPLEQECSPYPVPEDAPTETILAAGGRGYICYLPAPDGLCIAVDGAEAAGVVAAGGPEAAGCEDGVLQIDGTCPTDLQVGQCALAETGEVWTLYPCNRWNDLPGGEAEGCRAAGGTWTPQP